MYSEHYNAWYYDAQSTEEELEGLRDYYNPHVDKFRYLYLSWADTNAWKEWHLIEQSNVNLTTLGVVFEWYNETTEEYNSVVYNQTLTEFETRHIAVESIYPYDTSTNSGDFDLSQDYSGAQDLDIYSITGYYFNESEYEFDLGSCYVISGEESIHVEAEIGLKLKVFETIVVLINFTSGALSDYSQFRLLDNAIDHHLEAPVWTKNDSIYIDFEYNDLDYFLLLEDYDVGSEDSLFELLEYTRNAKFVQIEQENFVFDINYHKFDYENFSAQIELKSVLLMTDFNEDGTHECVVEKHDVTGDGEYNVFKYGYVNLAGEISYHTIISQAEPSQVSVDKQADVSYTDWFDLKQSTGTAKRTLYRTTIIDNTVDKMYYSVQKDLDLDGLMDAETSYEVIYSNIQVTTYTKEITVVKAIESGTLKELRVSTFVDSSMSQVMVFTDIVSDEVVSTRVYEDAFPNEFTEFNNVENYLVPVVSGTISSQTPDLNSLFSLSHAEDNVPAEFDRVTTIANGEIITDNLLFTTQTISIPGVYSESGQGFDSYAIEAIKSIPAEDTRWINDPKGSSLSARDEGGYYLYFDSSEDGTYETIFVMDENDNVVGIGFDYDQDSRFHPAKTISVLKEVLWSKNYQGISIENDYIHFKEGDKEIGTFNEPTFSDVLFDVFLMDFYGDSSELIELAESMATNQFEEEVTPLTMVGDIAQQVVAGLVGLGVGVVLTPIGLPHVGFFAGYLGTNLLFQWIKIIERENFIAHRTFVLDSSDGEKVLGSKFWFDDMFGNVLPLTIFGSVGGVYAPVFLETDKHSYSGDIILREFNLADTKASSFTTSYTYPKLDYWLSTRNLAGYSDSDDPLMTQFLSRIGVLNPILTGFGIAEYNHAKSSVYYVENEIREETFENGDAVLNTIFPTIDYGGDAYSPRMSFADSRGSFPIPEFYTEYPVFVSEGYPELEDFGSIYKLVPIEDIAPSGVEIQLFNGDIGLKADVVSVDAYVFWSRFPASIEYSEGRSPRYVNTLIEGDFELESATGVLTITSKLKLTEILSRINADSQMIQENNEDYNVYNWSYYVVFQVKVEKYRSVTDLRDLTSEQVGKIATAQAVEAAIFEYNYQFNLATQTQMGYHELFYTIIVTAVSTAITMGATLCVGKVVQLTGSLANTATKELSKSASKTLMGLLQPTAGFTASGVAYAVLKEIGQEVLIDPWIESAVSGWVRRAGGDAMMQMVLSSVAESLRETLTGPFTNLFRSQQSGGASFYERLDAKYFSKGLTPTVQDLLNSFNDYNAEIEVQIEQRKEQTTALGRGMKALTFVLGAIGFSAAAFLGPPSALLYTTLTTYCYTEGISLKGAFNKIFNPVKIAVIGLAGKISNLERITKAGVLKWAGIGTAYAGLTLLSLAIQQFAPFGSIGISAITIGMVKQKDSPKKDDYALESEVRELIDTLTNLEKSSLDITEKEAIRKHLIAKSKDFINEISLSKISGKDLRLKVEKLLKNLKLVDKMTHFEFLEFYKQNFNNDYSEKFKTLDLSNFVGLRSSSISSAKKYPNTQDKLLHKFIDLSTKATKAEEIPYIIYAFVNKKRPEDGIRIGYTGNLPQIRVEGYQKDSKLKIYEGFPLYEDIKLQGIDNFKIIILDVQMGRKNALISESFFTISFNRDAKAKYGYDLSINLGYNKHVGDLTSLKGDEHYGYKKGIFFDDVNHLIESGYEMKDIAVIYGVQEKTIAERLRTWYSDQFGNTKIYNKVSTYLRTKKLIEYYSQGLMAHEIAKKFVKFDVSDKSTVFSIPKEAHDNLYVKGFLNTKHYSTMTINQWTLNNLKISSSLAYEKYFVKPIVISLLQLGYDAQEAVEVLEAMGITNPNKIGTPYSSQALVHLINERLWGVTMGKKWKELRKILMEPIIESLIRAGLTQSQVASKTHRSMSFIARFINNVWSFTSFKAARDFFHVPGGWGRFLGQHKADYYLYN